MKFRVREKDRGWSALREAVKKADGKVVKVGVIGEGGKERRECEPITNVELAVIHEFGSPAANIPERSFIRSTFEVGKANYQDMLKCLAPGILDGRMTAEQALGVVGAKMAADMKNRIRDGIPPPNAASTVARKGSSTPLVDTGQLINSITWSVEKKAKP